MVPLAPDVSVGPILKPYTQCAFFANIPQGCRVETQARHESDGVSQHGDGHDPRPAGFDQRLPVRPGRAPEVHSWRGQREFVSEDAGGGTAAERDTGMSRTTAVMSALRGTHDRSCQSVVVSCFVFCGD